jgi:beta-barrel assembly-enhancing protease
MEPGYRRRPSGGGKGRLIIGIVMALLALAGYYGSRSFNPVTEEVQHVDISPEQEVALGLQAAPEMAQQFGGLHPDQQAQGLVDRICRELVTQTSAKDTPYEFDCHVLADEQTINAFALPGGQVFITAGLMDRLQTEGQLAGVLGHEIGHVVARHGAEHIAKARLTQDLTGAAVIATYDPENPSSQRNAAVAALIGQLVNMRFGRQDELESDRLGVRFLAEAGYDPSSMIEVMRILEEASGGGARQPEFFSTHPNPDNRIASIQAAIAERFPQGVPEGMKS